MNARERLMVALDVPTPEAALALVERLGTSVVFYKIGMELIYGGGGLALAERLIGQGAKVFIDLKLHDIPNTVEKATAQIARLGATFLTVHAYSQTMKAALAGAAGSGLGILGVSVLTSSDDSDLAEAGYALGARALVSRRALQAEQIGLAGLVASAAEVAGLRAEGRKLTLVCPGIRPAGGEVGDQKRVATPGRAIADGADYLVVGRPITGASDPKAAAEGILREMAGPSLLNSDPATRLNQLEICWNDLKIQGFFHQVHHFSSPQYSGRHESMKSFISWCRNHNIEGQNLQTLDRALCVVEFMKEGERFDHALTIAWKKYPALDKFS